MTGDLVRGAIAWPSAPSPQSAWMPSADHIAQQINTSVPLFRAGHDMCLIGDVQWFTQTCPDRAEALMATRALSLKGLRDVMTGFDAFLFDEHLCVAERTDRLQALQSSLVRVHEQKAFSQTRRGAIPRHGGS